MLYFILIEALWLRHNSNGHHKLGHTEYLTPSYIL